MKYGIIVLAWIFIHSACVEAVVSHDKLPPGIYRAVLLLKDDIIVDDDIEVINPSLNIVEPDELAFNFEVKYIDSTDDFTIVLHNADERITVDQIKYGKDRSTNRDTVRIEFPIFDSYIKAIYNENVLQGHWVVNYRENYKIPFIAYHGLSHRFTNINKENQNNISGKWECTFTEENGDTFPAVGVFNQEGNKVTGTFMTETGDYRFLEGNIIDNKFYLSVFDGSHAFLFEGKILADNKLIGTFRSGTHYTATWEGELNESIELTDPFELTAGIEESAIIDFSFRNTDNKLISLSDPAYSDHVKIVKVMGTWCPNCMDATNFLLEYIEDNKLNDVDVLAIGFEKYKDETKSIAALKNYKARKKIPFEVLYGGYFEKDLATKHLPFLDKIISYPTLLFFDKQNRLRKVHTGFAGPATEKYESFQKEFNAIVNQLRSET